MTEKEIGTVTHFFGKISVGIIELCDALKVGDKIRVKGHAGDFTQDVSSMRIEYDQVTEAKAGDKVGIQVSQKVHQGDKVYLVA